MEMLVPASVFGLCVSGEGTWIALEVKVLAVPPLKRLLYQQVYPDDISSVQ